MRNMLLLVTLSGLLTGCATTSPTPDPTPPNTTPMEKRSAGEPDFTFQLVHQESDGGAVAAIANRGSLDTNNRFALRLRVQRPLYVYAWRRGDGAAATPERIFPAEGRMAEQARPQSPVFIPSESADQWWKRDAAQGRQTFFVVAAKEALDDAKLRAIEADIPIDREPGTVSASDRVPGPSYSATLDETGVASLLFTILPKSR